MKTLRPAACVLFFVLLTHAAVPGLDVAIAADSFSDISLPAAPVSATLSLTAVDMASVKSLSDEQLTNLLTVLAATPTISYAALPRTRFGEESGGTFYSLQHLGEWPPMPCDSSRCTVWKLADCFVMDDVGVTYNTSVKSASQPTSAMSANATPPPGPGSGSSGTNSFFPNGWTNPIVNFGTNLWLSPPMVVSGSLNGVASNTIADVSYEIQSCTNLAQANWQSEGFFSGSELTNWTPWTVSQNGRIDLFLRLRSWLDTYGIGIPDWWQLLYFGTVGIDPDASAANDGFSNLQKFDLGLNPTNYYNPNGPPGFFGYVDATGTNVFIAWSAAPGPVLNYSIQRGISNSLTGLYTYSQVGTVSSNANFIKDAGAINNSNAWNNLYQLEAVYPGGSLSATDTWYVSWYVQYGTTGLPYGPPAPTNFYACADTNATNVLLSWTPASGVATNYLIERGIFNAVSNTYTYHQITAVSPATNSFKVTGPFTNAANWSDNYAVIAVYPGGVQSPLAASPVNVGFTNGSAAPATFYGYADGTGTNLVLAWTPAAGAPTNYVLFAGTTNANGACAYVKLATVNAATNSLFVTNGFNNLYQAYAVFAAYTNGSLSQAAFWQSANGTPAPGNFVAYLDATGTNVWLSWTAPTGAITGYLITRTDPGGQFFTNNLSSSRTSFEDTNAVNTGSFDPASTEYTLAARFPQGGLSVPPATAMVSTLPAPTGLAATLDASGKNVDLTWDAVPGAINYVIERGVLNPATGMYSYSTIGTVGPGVTSFADTGAISGANSYNNKYEVEAVFPGGADSSFANSSIAESSAIPLDNVYVSAILVRNGTGRWQVMFSGLPTNSPQTIQLAWTDYIDVFGQTNLVTTNLINGVYPIPDALALNLSSSGFILDFTVQLFGPNGEPGQIEPAGFFGNDAPYFVDGRQHLKQNLDFLLRAAPMNQLFFSISNAASQSFGGGDIVYNGGDFNVSGTSFEEFSFLHHLGWGSDGGVYGLRFEDLYYFQIDDLWPFTANYQLANFLADSTRTSLEPYGSIYGSTNFIYQPNFATNVPAPAILGPPDPYRILQLGLNSYLLGLGYSSPPGAWGLSINAQTNGASLSIGNNLFGLPYNSGYLISYTNLTYNYQTLSPGGNATAPPGYRISDYASWCTAPSLSLVNYYFAPLLPPEQGFSDISGLSLPGELDSGNGIVQPFPVPIEDDFNVTNQSAPLIATVGQPMIIGSWAKYSVQGSSPTKYAYLGQYFVTNAFLLNSNGVATTNSAGILSPYGEFFPQQTGVAQIVTLPDIDPPYEQGTNVVKIISMNVDANHDGVVDLSYAGPDQNSPSRPFRFWANDNHDSGDDGGDGVPGKVGQEADGYNYEFSSYNPVTLAPIPIYQIHGVRDLVDFFPVYINIGSLFQTNALSAGISVNDTNYQFILSQADGVLRFTSTTLTPTNYMNFLRDTNEARYLGGWPNGAGGAGPKVLTTIANVVNGGVPLPQSFIAGVATNNQGIILVEAAAPTTQPLVLTIYHGTNQIAQTQLYLSISGVEQMFRSKNLLLQADPRALPDRLTDASVPNEPDTLDKNFIFLHGYNVNPYEARGAFADMYKRLYWSGSHAKFYGVMWNGYDTQSRLLPGVTGNLETNVVHAFNTASALNTFLNSLTGPNVVAAHSLGNMVVLSTLNDYTNQSISQHFMIDAAVAMEALDGTTPQTANLVHTDWTGYGTNLWASYWHNLFPAGDGRSQLTWNNRLAAGLQNAAVYNFYSSGEEVLRAYPNTSTPSFTGFAGSQILQSIFDSLPVAAYLWNMQELQKGRSPLNDVLGSDHGGWKFNDLAYGTNGILATSWTHMSPAAAAALTPAQLQTNAFFDVTDFIGQYPPPFTQDLNLYGTPGSGYAKLYRNRLLSDTIPALSLPVGANPLPGFSPPLSPTLRNFDMQASFENNWPSGRPPQKVGALAQGEWWHSDFQQAAYTFTYKLFNQFVTLGNLK